MEEAYTIASLFKVTSEVVLYWVSSGIDITQGEMMVIPIKDPRTPYTVGHQALTLRSSALLHMILQKRTNSGQWPASVIRVIG